MCAHTYQPSGWFPLFFATHEGGGHDRISAFGIDIVHIRWLLKKSVGTHRHCIIPVRAPFYIMHHIKFHADKYHI